ncbi:hypothetical protein E1281_29535 [Actinomadura sp. KC345]|uniref:hypothetical protein n=1 Tax=Actinomadura sp. KC345 TaxID=2530371 RepID=UPI00104854B7|nr:hypothetical protein [Actinomadura sp. KC345]TDC45782.1 hypothetical protein E1281_29535 [Actinomadura sp. KC345]
MPRTSSAIARLRPARKRRRLVTRTEVRLIVASSVPAAQSSRSERIRDGVWTLYFRWEWATAKARAERARRRARASWR